jgi:hypothetical protein
MSTRRKMQRQHKQMRPRQALPEIVPAGRELEAETIMMMDAAWSGLSRSPSCDGPILVHVDGSFECHGDCNGGVHRSAMKTWHDLDLAVWPCNATERPPVDEIGARCSRCP